MSGAIFSPADAADTQALLRTAFDRLACNLLLLRIDTPATARTWLLERLPELASVARIGHDKPPVRHTLQLALSAEGLRQLGHEGLLEQFAPEFTTAPGDDVNRLRRLGDIGANSPEHWRWGVGERAPHLLLMLFCAPGELDERSAGLLASAAAAGLSLVESLPAADLDGFEPFGFRDGISQPELDWQGTRKPGGAEDMDYQRRIALGEFLLGYRNEYDLYTDRPLLAASIPRAQELPLAEEQPNHHDLGRNGTYLVLRQLQQDVSGFWRWVRQQSEGDDSALELAEAMVGRHLDGSPFARLNARDGNNDFTFADDRSGHACPFGAHIRRANPRTGDYAQGRSGTLGKLLALLGFSGNAEEDHIASARFHRLLRRGREYGGAPYVAIDGETGAPAETGLYFICLNANLARQFEFVQGAWIASATFAGLNREQDPLLGNRLPFPGEQPTDGFSQPSTEGACRFTGALPRFVTLRGGGYFFLPGLKALAWLLHEP